MNVLKKLIATSTLLAVFTTSMSVFPVTAETEQPSSQPGDKISADLQELMTNTTEKIPVIIWLENINDQEVEYKIKERIGFDIDSLDATFSPPSDELIRELDKAANGDPNAYLSTLMNNYLKLTEVPRAIEKAKTDAYIEARTSIVSEIINTKIDKIIDSLGIESSDIVFAGDYLSMIICNLNPERIEAASENNNIKEITINDLKPLEACAVDFGTTKNTMGVTKINNILSLTGDGVKIGIYEPNTIGADYAPNWNIDMNKVTILGTAIPGDHPTYCAAIAAASNGIAPDAYLYSASSNGEFIDYITNMPSLESIVAQSDIVSISAALEENTSYYCNLSKAVDNLIKDYKKTIVCATGNYETKRMHYPASAYNCIAVNGFMDSFENQPNLYTNDYTYDHGSGCFKPDVIAPSFNNGTSASTPYIAGMIALLYEYKPSLKVHPELTKAILLASCHQKCSKKYKSSTNTFYNISELMTDGLTSRQGAGIPNMYKMISIVSQHTYGCGLLNSSNNYTRYVNFIQPKYNSSYINISLSFLQTDVPVGSGSGSITDCDLRVYNNNTYYDSSISKSSTELVYKALTNDSNYKLRINRYSGGVDPIQYGYAWSTNNEYYYNNKQDEGAYFLRNINSGYYLTDGNNHKAIQSDIDYAYDQIWVLKYNSNNNTYSLKNASLSSNGLGIGSSLGSDGYYAVENTSSTGSQLTLQFNNSNNDDFSYNIKRYINGNSYSLGIYSQSSSIGAYADWSPTNNSMSQKWYLEPANYRRGDVNLDELLDNTDVNLLYSYDTGLVTFNNLQQYLGDVNNDGLISLSDAIALAQIISG